MYHQMSRSNSPRPPPPFTPVGFWPDAYHQLVQNAPPPPVQTNRSNPPVMNPIRTATETVTAETRNIFYKTRLCHKFIERGNCPAGNDCPYAHGHGELRQPPPNWPELVYQRELDKGLAYLNDEKIIVKRMKICKDFYYGNASCPNGDNCTFLHKDPSVFKVEDISMVQKTEPRESVAISIGTTSADPPDPKTNMCKNRLCTRWETKGFCSYGAQCQFAHGILELQRDEIHPIPIPKQSEECVAVLQPVVEGWKERWMKKKPRKINGIYGDWLDGMSPPRGH